MQHERKAAMTLSILPILIHAKHYRVGVGRVNVELNRIRVDRVRYIALFHPVRVAVIAPKRSVQDHDNHEAEPYQEIAGGGHNLV